MTGSFGSVFFKTGKKVLLPAVLIAAGAAGNYFAVPLFVGMDFLLGSAAVLLMVRFFGIKWGLVAACVIGLPGHLTGLFPFAFVILPLEAWFVGLLLPKYENMILLDGLFWVMVSPLLGLYSYSVGHLNGALTLFVILKFIVNGIFNAFLASLGVAVAPMFGTSVPVQSGSPGHSVQLRETLFLLFIAFIFVPALFFMSINNRRQQQEMEFNIALRLQAATQNIVNDLAFWQNQHQHAVIELAAMAGSYGIRPSDELQRRTGDICRAFPDFLAVYVGDESGTSVAFYPPVGAKGENTVGLNFADRDYFREVKQSKRPGMSDVFVGRANVPFPVVTLTVPVLAGDRFRGFVLGALDLSYIARLLQLNSESGTIRATVLDRKGRVIASTDKAFKPMELFRRLNNGTEIAMDKNSYRWFPPPNSHLPVLTRWKNSVYVRETAVGGNIPWTVVAEIPAAPYYQRFQSGTDKNLTGVVVLFFLAVFLSSGISRRLVRPLSQLAAVTTRLPEKLFLHQAVEWPASKVAEIRSLMDNFQSMAATLQDNFGELQAAILSAEEGRNRWEAIIAGIGDGVSIQDPDFRIIYQNQILKNMIGDHYGKYCFNAYEGRSGVCDGCPVEACFKDGNVHKAERWVVTGQGARYLEITASPLMDGTGRVISGIEVVRDVTDRKIAEIMIEQQVAAIRSSMDGMAVLDDEEKYIFMNEAHAAIYGYDSPDELIGRSWRVLYDDQELRRFEDEIMPQLRNDGRWRGEAVGRKKDGTAFPQEISLTKTESGGLVCVVRDITERKRAEQVIWEEKERALVTLHSIGDAVITTDSAGRVEYLNPVAESLTGWTNAEAQGMPLQEVFRIENEETGTIPENPVDTCLREGRIVGLANHTVLISRNGQRLAIEDSAAPIRNREGQIIGVILVFHDVSEKRHLLQKMIHQAYHDPLTDLPNRVLFSERLTLAVSHAYRNQEKLAVMFLDLDRFKIVNDMLGHARGDVVLKEVAGRLLACVGESDTVARLGGDEFTVLLPHISQEEEAAKTAGKILQAFREPFLVDNHEFHITTSIGVVLYPNDGDDPETLMKHADMAMYRAKEQGRNTYQMFAPKMNERIARRLALENDLRHGLERGEFVLHYQPQVNIQTGRIKGMEALVRWQHPERGLIPPKEFIPLAEDTGLIVQLGEWVLRTACVQNRQLQESGLTGLKVTVNLSALQFRQKNLVETVARVLEETGHDPRLLELEITESAAMDDVDFTIAIMRQLGEMGIRIAIDDFGTGYSSLNYLKRFPINTLKIDRSFVDDLLHNPEDAAIVSALVVLARNLKLDVIAEGVETRDQLEFLKKIGCFDMQGFLFSKPLPAPDFEAMLREHAQKEI